MKYIKVLSSALWLLVAALVVPAKGEEIGIAAKYPGDKGIGQDSSVVFYENFEGNSVADVVKRWTSVSDDDRMSLLSDVPPSSSGKKSIQFTSINGETSGGRLYQRFSPGYDQLYMRYYVKYASKPTYYHHSGGQLAGCSQPTGTCGGNAGIKPGGNYFNMGFEPNYEFDQPATGIRMDFYVYWMNMRVGSSGSYWGNTFVHDPKVKVDYETWNCIETMLKINNPVTSSNGELAVWLNGVKINHYGPGYPKGGWTSGNDFVPDSSGTPFEGFQWRDVESLKITLMKIEHYVEDGEEEAGFVGKLGFDDLVIATKYIGPISLKTGKSGFKPSVKPFKQSAPQFRKSVGKGNSFNLMIEKFSDKGLVEYFSLKGDRIYPGVVRSERFY